MLDRVRGLLREPLDQSTPERRGRERGRRATLSAGMSLAAKIVSVGTALLTVPLTLNYLGAERYGMWLIISSLTAILSFADFGMGNGLLNIVAAAHGRNDTMSMRLAVSSAMAALTGVALTFLLVFAITYQFIPWYQLFNVQTALARAEAGPAVAVFVLCFALAMPTGIVQRVQLGLQGGFLASSWQCVGSLLSLAGVLVTINCRAGLPWLVFALMGGPLLAMLINSLHYFGRLRPDIAPSLRATTRAAASKVIKSGLLFLLLQVAAAVTYDSGPMVIAQLLGAAAVPEYSVPERLFSLITMLASMALQPLWPAYRESIVRGDFEWTRSTLKKSICITVAFAAVLSTALIVATPWILQLWVGNRINPPFLLIVGLAMWKVIEAGGLALAMFLNGAHVIKPQVIFASITALAAITLSIILVHAVGISGAVWGTAIAFFLFAFIPYCIMTPQILRGLRGAP